MKITMEVTPEEIGGLVKDLLNGNILGNLSYGTTNFAFKVMEVVQKKLNEEEGECETIRPFIEQFFCGYSEVEGTEEDEASLFDIEDDDIVDDKKD